MPGRIYLKNFYRAGKCVSRIWRFAAIDGQDGPDGQNGPNEEETARCKKGKDHISNNIKTKHLASYHRLTRTVRQVRPVYGGRQSRKTRHRAAVMVFKSSSSG